MIGTETVTLACLMDNKFGNYVVQRVYSMCTMSAKTILVEKIRQMGSSSLLNLSAGSKALHVINHLETLGVKFEFMEGVN